MTQNRSSECERSTARLTPARVRTRNLSSLPGKLASCSAALLAGMLALFAAPSARAGTITVNSNLQQSAATTTLCTLGAAIASANANANVDGCAIVGGATAPYTINIPAATYTLLTRDHTTASWDFGLPLLGVSGGITLQGAGAGTTIIQRSTAAGTPNFGLLEMAGSGPWTINDLSLQNGNLPSAAGGAIHFLNLGGVFTVNRSSFINNFSGANGGGAISTFNGNVQTAIADSTFTNNTAVGSGGAINSTGNSFTVSNSTFTGNSSTAGGGAITYNGMLTLNDSTFSQNTAGNSGGAITGGGGAVTMARDVFLTNSVTNTTGTGGAIALSNGCGGNGSGSIVDSFFRGNTIVSSNPACGGGGAVSCSLCTISGSTFQSNNSGGGPGGAWSGGRSTITNTTFSGNSAGIAGGAITSSNTNTYNNVTITNNTSGAGTGGGINFGTGDIIRNSIVAGNTDGAGTAPDCAFGGGTPTSQGHNIIGMNAGCAITAATGDLIGTAAAPRDPVLGVLATNGGKTAGAVRSTEPIPTNALLIGSPALDAGDPAVPGSGGTACAATDERGIARPVGPACDIGAYEANPNTGVVPSVDVSVTISGAPDPVTPPSNLTYTITVANTVADTAPGITLTDVLPASVTFVSVSTPIGWATCTTPAVGSAGTVTCTKPSLAAVGSSVITLVVKPSTAGPLTNTVTVTTTGTDTNPANNTATVTTTVGGPIADLAITKSGSGLTTNVGSPFTYTINVTNAGPASATNVVVTDTLPGGVSFGSATPSVGTCSQAAGIVTCNLGTIANGGRASIIIVVTPSTPGSIVNTATVTATETDPTPADNTATTAATTVLPASADLSLTKAGAPNPVRVGSNLTYTLVVTNAGPSNATGVVLADTLPSTVTFVSATGTGCTRAGVTVTCNIGALANTATSTVTIVVTPQPGAAPSITNTATVAATEADPNPANNTASVTTTITPVADIAVTKTASATSVRAGSNLTYTITVINNGPSPATSVTITDTPPAAGTFSFVSATATAGTCAPPAAGKIVCTVGTLASGATATATVVITPNATAVPSIINSVTASATEFDPNTANNTASVTTTVTPAVGPDFTVTLSPANFTVARGSAATYTATVTPVGGFTGAVSLTCSGAPFLANCVITPSSVTITSTSGPQTATVTVQTTTAFIAPNAMRPPQAPWMPPITSAIAFTAAMLLALFAFALIAYNNHSRSPRTPVIPSVAARRICLSRATRVARRAVEESLFALQSLASLFVGSAFIRDIVALLRSAFAGARTRRFAALTALVLLVICAGYLSGCEGRARKVVGTPSGTYPITVTATSGSIQHSATSSLTVQ